MHTYPYCTYSPFFFQLRVQQSALKAGEAHYSSRVDDIRVLKMKVKVFIMNIWNFTFNIQSNILLLSCPILSYFMMANLISLWLWTLISFIRICKLFFFYIPLFLQIPYFNRSSCFLTNIQRFCLSVLVHIYRVIYLYLFRFLHTIAFRIFSNYWLYLTNWYFQL